MEPGDLLIDWYAMIHNIISKTMIKRINIDETLEKIM